MNEAAIIQYIVETFPEGERIEANGDSFFMFDPEHNNLPFATLVTSNAYDDGSDLDRPGVFRLNFGVGKATFRSLFGDAGDAPDYTALDRLMPHPEYGKMYWVCVLNPSAATFQTVQPLLAESYAMAVARREKHSART